MIVIRTPKTRTEYLAACQFVERIYKERGYVSYLQENPSVLFCAFDDKEIIGAVGIISKEEEPLPTEIYFNFSIIERIGRSDAKIAEICRLAAIGKTATKGLFIAFTLYSLQYHITDLIASVKPPLIHLIKKIFDLPIREYNDLRPQRKFVPKRYHGYFFGEPKPIPIMGIVDEVKPLIQKMKIKEEGIRLDLTEYGFNRFLRFDELPEVITS